MQVVKDANTAHQLFQQGNLEDAQITGTTAQGMQNDKNLKHLHRAGVYYLQLNMRKNRVFSNAKMREALNLVLDKKQLAGKVLADGSTPADTFVAPTLAKDQSTGVDFAKEMKPEETHNVAKVQKLWDEGLKEEGRKRADLTYYTDDQTINKNIAQFVQSQVETKLKHNNVEIHAVPAKSKSAEQTDRYWENMRNAQNQLTKDTAVVPLYNMTESHLVRKNLRGISWHPVGEVDYTRAYFN